jgi:hypothetical protein
LQAFGRPGAPILLLRDYTCAKDVDVMVLGIRQRNAILGVSAGCAGKAIKDEVSCDVLVLQILHPGTTA